MGSTDVSAVREWIVSRVTLIVDNSADPYNRVARAAVEALNTNGVRTKSDFSEDDPAADRVTCGECGRSWDDAVVTSMTPAPSARCPFEAFH